MDCSGKNALSGQLSLNLGLLIPTQPKDSTAKIAEKNRKGRKEIR
jgi:hypothetical protein